MTERPSSTETVQEASARQAQIDAQLGAWFTKSEDSDPSLPEAQKAVDDLLDVRISPYPEQEPGILGRLKTLFSATGSQLVRERVFRGIVQIAAFGKNPRAKHPAHFWIQSFTPEQQIANCGGIAKAPDALLLFHTYEIRDPLSHVDNPVVREAARRAQLYPGSALRRALVADYLKVEFPEGLGKTESGGDMESVGDLAFRFREDSQATVTA